jgi:murein DD-endopeptidase MepM/ murein hydrolase activator NlpD
MPRYGLMPALKTPYLVLAAVLFVVVAIGAIALVAFQPPADQVAAVPTPSATAATDASGNPGPDQTPSGDATSSTTGVPQTPVATHDPAAKDLTPVSDAPKELDGYIWPVRNALITSRMAARDFGGFVIIDGQEVHDGLDLATHCGDKVMAAHDGVVLYAGRNFDPYIGYLGDATPIYARLERLGRTNEQPIVVVIDDGNGYRSMYVHLNEANVEQGAVVEAGDVIGREGMTGFATGCHLHYTMIRMDGDWQEVVPRLARFGYPPYVRERIDPLDVLPWGDEFAPEKLRNRVNGTPSPAFESTAPGSPAPESAAPENTAPESTAPETASPEMTTSPVLN